MTMGIVDLPAPLFTWLDELAGGLPLLLRVLAWGLVAGIGSMLVYLAVSPQQAIARGKREQLSARRRLEAFDGELAEAWPLMRHLLGTSLRQVGRVLLPALLASLPLLCLVAWMSNRYSVHLPADGTPPALEVAPARWQARWEPAGEGATIALMDGERVVTRVDMAAPASLIEPRHWWNALIGNPAGYLAADGGPQRIDIVLPRTEVLAAGPDWLRGWEASFFCALLLSSLALKTTLRIH